MKIPSVFKKNGAGHAIPELAPDMYWVMAGDHQVLTTIKIDGITIKVSQQSNGYTIHKQIDPVTWVASDRQSPADKLLWEALDNSMKAGAGTYVAYGPGIKGNPQKASKPFLTIVQPVCSELIMYGTSSGIDRKAPTVQAFYESCRAALTEGDAEGVVFHWEEPAMRLKAWGQVTRRDFGLAWPLPAEILTPSQALAIVQGH